jgi:hypothetical protein
VRAGGTGTDMIQKRSELQSLHWNSFPVFHLLFKGDTMHQMPEEEKKKNSNFYNFILCDTK